MTPATLDTPGTDRVLTTSSASEATFETLKAELMKRDKAEYHMHLNGSWPKRYLQQIATAEEFTEFTNFLEKMKSGIPYSECFQVFTLISNIVNTDQKVEDGVVALCHELRADGVTYVEIRTGLKDLGSGLEGYLKSVLNGMKRGAQETGVTVNLILSLRRDSKKEIAEQTVNLALQHRNQGIVGLDLSGDSTVGDANAIFPYLLKARENGLPLTLHLGESPEETPLQQVNEFDTLLPDRVGHGALLCDYIKSEIRRKEIPVELCPTSAVQVKMVKELKNHWGVQLLREGHPVAICTDDPLIFGRGLSEEMALVALELGLSADQIIKSQEKVVKARFNNYR